MSCPYGTARIGSSVLQMLAGIGCSLVQVSAANACRHWLQTRAGVSCKRLQAPAAKEAPPPGKTGRHLYIIII